ncbi:MAG TPA: hypothetical protein DCY93_02925 [Firmicutes bacterium]|nr:hypothetical protein [Bacillota bacterium]
MKEIEHIDLKNLNGYIKKTPLSHYKDSNNNDIYVKEESFNPSGSIKDRVFYYVLSTLKNEGKIKRNTLVTLASSGNAAISLAKMAPIFDINVVLFLPNSTTNERRKILSLTNAKLLYIAGKMEDCSKIAQNYADENEGIYLDQFSNELFLSSHQDTSKEIFDDLDDIDYAILTSGSGVTISALGRRLKEHYPNLKIIAYELEEAKFITQKKFFPHKIEGIGPNFTPKNLNASLIDKTISLPQEHILSYCQKLYSLGYNYGPSTVGCFLAIKSLSLQNKHILIVSYDNADKYLTALINEKEEN